MTDAQIVLLCVLAWWVTLSAFTVLTIRAGGRRERRNAMRRHPAAQHPDGDCDDPECCASAWDSALWVLMEERR